MTTSKTGTYKLDPVTGKIVKVSDKIPKCLPDATCPVSGYYDPHLGCEIRSRRHKAEVMRSQEVREVGNARASDFVRQRSQEFSWPETWNQFDG